MDFSFLKGTKICQIRTEDFVNKFIILQLTVVGISIAPLTMLDSSAKQI